MEVKSTSVAGFVRMRLLASLKPLRLWSHRSVEEQSQIEAWLGLVVEAASQSAALALEIADCARLIKGYGDTHVRGRANFGKLEERVMRPALAGRYSVPMAVDAIAAAHTAALADPEGERFEKTLEEIERRAQRRVAAD
jgi:indolepyruvate ferredoxin oxidoreductase, beta subunit